MPSSKFADEVRDNHALGESTSAAIVRTVQRRRSQLVFIGVYAQVELAIPIASGNSSYPCIAWADWYSGI